MLRYVVLHHTGYGEPHFDLMIQRQPDGPLWTVRCSEWPPGPACKFERLGDHRAAYLTYEGPVSNDRGEVKRVAAGEITAQIEGELVVLTTKAGLSFRLPRPMWV